MIVQAFPSGPFATNAYVIACKNTHDAAIIDPAPSSANAIISYLNEQQLKPEKIVITHSHWDHIGDAASIKSLLNLSVAIHPLDLPNLEEPGTDGLPLLMPIKGASAEELLSEGDMIPIGDLDFEVIHTPGHTPGGICLYCKDRNTLISGDTLFSGSIGNLSFPTANSSAYVGVSS